MAQQTTVPLDQMAQHLFGLIDALDAEAVKALVTSDCEEVDEISRTWRRGRAAIAGYFDEVLSTISDVHTDVGDVAIREWADTGVVTCVIDQTYRYEGKMERITAPTTLLFRRESGDWRIALMHTVPLPEAATS